MGAVAIPTRARPARAALRPAPRRVLLVEDDGAMRAMLAFVLRRNGYTVQTARNGEEALGLLGDALLGSPRKRPFDLVVTDHRMPGFVGVEILEALRLAAQHVPVIVITAFGDEELHSRVESFDLAAVLDKPFEIEALLGLARRYADPSF